MKPYPNIMLGYMVKTDLYRIFALYLEKFYIRI